uniref:Uncharacterized protein n=1 Tax=Meloidogyne enterolobii TaxID=390850 RepID=A0A6V7VP74_MELEN|nr:unnamed protein product [Meloidogyne enterolobii]
MNLNKKKKTIPNELLVDIFKSLNIPPNELELNILEEESTTKIFKQLKKYSKNLLVSSRILTIIVGEVFKKRKIAAILVLTMENKNKFLQERVDVLTAREAEFVIEVNQIRADFNQIETNFNQTRADFDELVTDVTEAKNKIYKWKKILIIIMFINCFIICFWVYRMFSIIYS